ncbi:hypothetical protein QTP88_018421 [Uroleucon formosanum]
MPLQYKNIAGRWWCLGTARQGRVRGRLSAGGCCAVPGPQPGPDAGRRWSAGHDPASVTAVAAGGISAAATVRTNIIKPKFHGTVQVYLPGSHTPVEHDATIQRRLLATLNILDSNDITFYASIINIIVIRIISQTVYYDSHYRIVYVNGRRTLKKECSRNQYITYTIIGYPKVKKKNIYNHQHTLGRGIFRSLNLEEPTNYTLAPLPIILTTHFNNKMIAKSSAVVNTFCLKCLELLCILCKWFYKIFYSVQSIALF